MPLRFPRGTLAVLLSASLGWVVGCSGGQQAEAPAGQAQVALDTVIPPHLRDFVHDTAAPFIAVVRNELAHALDRHREDKSVDISSIDDPVRYLQGLRRSFRRVDSLLAGRLKKRLVAVGFDTTLTQDYATAQFFLAKATPGWETNDEQALITLGNGGLLTYSGTRGLHTDYRAQSIDTEDEFLTNEYHLLAFIDTDSAQPAYEPLDIPPASGVSVLCLYVSADSAFFKIPPCNERSFPVANPPTRPTLIVQRTHHPNHEVPNFARWEWAHLANQNTIGVRCGKSWCQIAQKDFERRHHEPLDPNPDESNGKQSHVRGWYDFQVLAMPSSSGLEPKGRRALIRPRQAMEDEMNNPSPHPTDRFVTVAEAKLTGAPSGKYATMGLENGRNLLAICNGTEQSCGATQVPNPQVCVDNTTDGRSWYLRITRGMGSNHKYYCLKYHEDQPGGAVFPSTTRWMWLPNDEGMWFRCPAGCCQKT